MYSPSAHNVPVFTQQGDSKIAASYSINGGNEDNSGNGLDVQGAYAITKHVAVQAGYSVRNEKQLTQISAALILIIVPLNTSGRCLRLGPVIFAQYIKETKYFFRLMLVQASVNFLLKTQAGIITSFFMPVLTMPMLPNIICRPA